MCGIAGFISSNPLIDRKKLRSMSDLLFHRGPDNHGIEMWDENGNSVHDGKGLVGLSHRRLSIIDLSPAGKQPMCNETRDIWITYNGEFYNYLKYRKELEKKHNFISNTDTETILHSYEEDGIEKTIHKINGMFAFALWDYKNRKLFLVRDRIGKKPLYYFQTPDGSLVFASEIKALLITGMIDQNKIDPVALFQFWTYGYTIGERTIYAQVRRLLPGHYAVWSKGNLRIKEYWDCRFSYDGVNIRKLDDYSDELEALLIDSIRLRFISDVPVGLFLSGGIDSSLIAALAAKVTQKTVQSFTISFSHEAFDESRYAASVANSIGISNRILGVRENQSSFFHFIAKQFDEPFGDSSSIPTYFLSKIAKEYVSVALTGDAGDELFGGYNAYAKGLWLWGDKTQRKLFAQRISFAQKFADSWLRYIPRDKRLTELEKVTSPLKLKLILSSRLFSEIYFKDVFYERKRWLKRVYNADLLSQMQYLNLKTYLPDDILVKVDRMSMCHALECRSPFLDYRIVELASRLPYFAKIDEFGRQKIILRNILKRYIPERLIDRPKMGFQVPWAYWCIGKYRDDLRNKWLSQNNGYHRRSAARIIFPHYKLGWPSLQWNAFCILIFSKIIETKRFV